VVRERGRDSAPYAPLQRNLPHSESLSSLDRQGTLHLTLCKVASRTRGHRMDSESKPLVGGAPTGFRACVILTPPIWMELG
jgi:hypothetical protein